MELSHQGAHQLIQYELSWCTNGDGAMEANEGETDADLRQMCGQGYRVQKG